LKSALYLRVGYTGENILLDKASYLIEHCSASVFYSRAFYYIKCSIRKGVMSEIAAYYRVCSIKSAFY